MVSPSTPQTGLAPIASLPGRFLPRLRAVTEAGLWIGGIVLASLAVSWLTGRMWSAAIVGIAFMIMAAWRWLNLLAAAQSALDRAKQDRAAMEQALRRSQKMEALGRLTVGVAHDFNNHLTVISSSVEMVARRLLGTQDGLLRHTEAAMQGVQRAAMLTGRLLSFSRQPEPEPELLDIDRLVGGLADLLRRTMGERNNLEIVRSHDQWFTWADVNQMEHALLSLAVNARDRLRTGATLTIKVSTLRLDAVLEAHYPSVLPGDYILIELRGFERDDRPNEWVPADDPSSADLSMAYMSLREAGGYLLRADPADGELSMRVLLPRYTPPSIRTALLRRETGGRPTILVVEDDAAVRCACVGVLRELDYDVLEAADAMEAFRVIADHGGIDLLFTDLGLPGGVSGRALADAARNVDAGLRVLFTTGYERADALDRAGTVLLRKPFTPAQLVSKVRDVLAADCPVAASEAVQG